MERVGGIISLKIDGNQLWAKGNFTYNLGLPLRQEVVGADFVHGFSERAQPAFIEGEITDNIALDLRALQTVTDATITLELGNGKNILLRNASFAGEGTANTEEGNIAVRFISRQGEEIK